MSSSSEASSPAAVMSNHAEYVPHVLGVVNPGGGSGVASPAQPMSGTYANKAMGNAQAQSAAYVSPAGAPVRFGDSAASDVVAVPIGTTAGGTTIVAGSDGAVTTVMNTTTPVANTTAANMTALNSPNAVPAVPATALAASNLSLSPTIVAAAPPTPTAAALASPSVTTASSGARISSAAIQPASVRPSAMIAAATPSRTLAVSSGSMATPLPVIGATRVRAVSPVTPARPGRVRIVQNSDGTVGVTNH